MIYGSVCSGIEAATVAWHPLGWRPAWFAEIEPFPQSALRQHYGSNTIAFSLRRRSEPKEQGGVWNLGDFTTIKPHWLRRAGIGAIDVLVGGTPCQSFSVAGKRAGLGDPRGNLTLEFLALAGRLRPRWVVWENVPSVLSIDGGRTFGAVLGILGKLGYGFAYRVLDAQYFGVPQRRRRVFVVGYLGDWRRAAAVLFERESLSGNFDQDSETQGQGNGVCVSYTVSSKWSKGYGGPSGDELYNMIPVPACIYCKHCGEFLCVIHWQHAYDCPCPSVEELDYDPYAEGAIRRLLPVECERLQGLPDNYTLIPYRGKPAADSRRYKAIGNAMAVPVMRWIGERIQMVEAIRSMKGEITWN